MHRLCLAKTPQPLIVTAVQSIILLTAGETQAQSVSMAITCMISPHSSAIVHFDFTFGLRWSSEQSTTAISLSHVRGCCALIIDSSEPNSLDLLRCAALRLHPLYRIVTLHALRLLLCSL
ncbi:hypothetical protein BDV19DRAFT_9025 [Aspergillus venezuelensis]